MLASVRQSNRFAAPVVAVAVLMAAMPVARVAAAPKPPAGATSAAIPIVGTVVGGGTFTGILNLNSFAVQQGALVATGTVTGVATNAAGAATSVLATVTAPVSVAQAACAILHLDLGPLSLNVLGLQVNLSQVVLDITAQPGPGNLLGNLLCSVAGLLDNPGGLARLLNDILGALLG
jgi:hypothetical protein